MVKLPGLMDVTSDLQIKTPQVNVVIDRDKAAAVNVRADRIENALYDAYGPKWISTIYTPKNQYKVLIETGAEVPDRSGAAARLLYMRSDHRPTGSARHRGANRHGPGRRPSTTRPACPR